MKISIIIPIFNSEKYLAKCLESLKNQTYKNLEIILIDDGSTDSSANICKKFVKKDFRFKYFYKKNGGTSSARNFGIRKATGDYLTFVDNDDFIINKKTFELIAASLIKNQPDILFSKCVYYWDNADKYVYPKDNYNLDLIHSSDRNISLKYLISSNLFSYTVWDKVINMKIIKDYKLFFSEGKRNEDSEFCIKLLELSSKFDYYSNPYYVYRKAHSYAQTSKLKYKDTYDLKELIKFYLLKYNDDEYNYLIYNYISYLYAVYIAQTFLINDKKTQLDIQEMKTYKFLLKYNLNKNMKLVSLLYRLFGFNITRIILAIYLKKKYNLAV